MTLEDGSQALVTDLGRQPDPQPEQEFDQPNYAQYDNPDQYYPAYGEYSGEQLRDTGVKSPDDNQYQYDQYEQQYEGQQYYEGQY